MLPATLLFAAVACLVCPVRSGPVKRNTEPDDYNYGYDEMFALDSPSYEGSGGDVYDYGDINEISRYFYVIYDKPFNDEWLSPGSAAFKREARTVKNTLTKQIARSLGVIEADVSVEVIGFLPGSTKAEFAVRIPEYHKVTERDLANGVKEVAEFTTIDGATIEGIEEIQAEYTAEGLRKEMINMELTYGDNIADRIADLSDSTSEEFLEEAISISQQLSLILVDKLSSNGNIVLPDEISVEVLSFESEGEHTKVQISVAGSGVDVERLSYALQHLVLDDDVRLNGGTVFSAEELSREIIYDTEDYPEMDEKVMDDDHNDFLNGYDAAPEDEDDLFSNMKTEVMADKKDNLELNGMISDETSEESAPPDDGVVVPPIESVPPGEETSPPDNEPVPPDYEYDPPEEESSPYDDGEEREPPDDTVRCPEIRAPEAGQMDCFNEFEIGSQCQFLCDPDARMEGTDTTQCGEDGQWSYDAPNCTRILCQPSAFSFPNGEYHCSNDNVYQSHCTFMCKNDEFELTGEKDLLCQEDETWSSEPPTCEPIPVNCDDHYGPWSDCANGVRSKAEITVTMADKDTVCTAIVEVCIDCQLEWEPWSTCDELGFRYRSQFVGTEKVGAGQDCPEPKFEREECQECVLDWTDWGPCELGRRQREQYVKVQPVGDHECPELMELEMQDCSDCEIGWGDFGECVGGVATRQPVIVTEATNGGRLCAETEMPEDEIEVCQNCEVAWPDWPECEDGERRRTEVVVAEALGSSGSACPELRSDSEVCVHCELEWGDWEECIEGQRQRQQFISVERQGAGRPCDFPGLDMIACSNCELAWGEWGECSGGQRSRQQIIVQQPFQVDAPCPDLQEDIELCLDCTYSWSEWSDCIRGEQTRFLLVDMEAVGAGELCPEEQIQIKECCYLDWEPWSECVNGQRTRNEEVIVQPDGESCREPRSENQDCADCVLEWGDWSECVNHNARRTQVVAIPAFGGGVDCPEVDVDTEYCADCKTAWSEWTDCDGDGFRFRSQVVVEDAVGRGEQCPETLTDERQACYDCEWSWSPWSGCEDGRKSRSLEILQPQVGAGEACPVEETEQADCSDCVVEWGDWSECDGNTRIREQYISVQPSGGGEECPELLTDFEGCANCVVAWEDWSECSNSARTRSQYVVTAADGAGRPCPVLATKSEVCIDCVVEWGPWSICYNSVQRRDQVIVVDVAGAGRQCPPLAFEETACEDDQSDQQSVVCRFARKVLGYGRPPLMRDLLLIGDESGSIGWVNFKKIKANFKSIARSVRGGIGSQETQIAMTSFALFSRTVFDFDDHKSVDDTVAAIDRTYFKGGYRSKIGEALRDANVWLFQQTGGMRSFPKAADNIEHEILIATDGCRTSDVYALQQGLKEVKKRGIKLYVLAVETPDFRCRQTVESMVEDKDDLFMVGGWDELDQLTTAVDNKVCFFDKEEPDVGGGDEPEEEEVEEETEEESGDGEPIIPEPIEGSRGDSAGF